VSSKVWSCFAGQNAPQMVALFQGALSRLNISYNLAEGPPRYMLDPHNPSTVFTVDGPEGFKCQVFHASNDPLARFFTRMFSSERQRFLICFLEIYPVNRANRVKISSLLNEVAKQAESTPWEIDHPRFRVSWLLRWRNKRKWQQYISYRQSL